MRVSLMLSMICCFFSFNKLSAQECKDSRYLTQRALEISNTPIIGFALDIDSLKSTGLLQEDEFLVKAEIGFKYVVQKRFDFQRSVVTIDGYKLDKSYETILGGSKSYCLRMSTYVGFRPGARYIHSSEIIRSEENPMITSAKIYVTKRRPYEPLSGYSMINSKFVRMGGLCFPRGCVEKYVSRIYYDNFALRNEGLDDLFVKEKGIILKCFKNADDAKPKTIKISGTANKQIAPGGVVRFKNRCPADSHSTMILAQVRGRDAAVAMDGIFTLYGR